MVLLYISFLFFFSNSRMSNVRVNFSNVKLTCQFLVYVEVLFIASLKRQMVNKQVSNINITKYFGESKNDKQDGHTFNIFLFKLQYNKTFFRNSKHWKRNDKLFLKISKRGKLNMYRNMVTQRQELGSQLSKELLKSGKNTNFYSTSTRTWFNGKWWISNLNQSHSQ